MASLKGCGIKSAVQACRTPLVIDYDMLKNVFQIANTRSCKKGLLTNIHDKERHYENKSNHHAVVNGHGCNDGDSSGPHW